MLSSPEIEDPKLIAWKRATRLRLGEEARELVMKYLSEYGKANDVDLDFTPEHIELVDTTAQGGDFEMAIQFSEHKLAALQPH